MNKIEVYIQPIKQISKPSTKKSDVPTHCQKSKFKKNNFETHRWFKTHFLLLIMVSIPMPVVSSPIIILHSCLQKQRLFQ